MEENETRVVLEPAPAPRRGWSRWRTLAFWCAALYFVLYALPFPVDALPTWSAWQPRLGGVEPGTEARSALEAWDRGLATVRLNTQEVQQDAATWVGRRVFEREVTVQPTGSGDTLLAYLQSLLFAAGALVLGPLLFLLFRARPPARWLRWALVVGVRYYLAFTLLGYGFFKVIKSQFPYPRLSRWIQPYGESSPMGILWTFMGISPAYNVFTGAGEVLGGALLLFRRTRTLGALVSAAVLSQVAMLNYAYDVPVKLYSTHLLALALVLVALDGSRLWRFFVANRPTEARDLSPPVRSRGLAALGWLVKGILVVNVVWGEVEGSLAAYRMRDGRARPELYGIWDVQSFERGGLEVPPLETDPARWRRLILDFPLPDGEQRVTIEGMDGTQRAYGLACAGEGGARTITLEELDGPDSPAAGSPLTLALERPAPGELVLQGELEAASVRVRLTRRLPEDFLLRNRGYHWINELPFNR